MNTTFQVFFRDAKVGGPIGSFPEAFKQLHERFLNMNCGNFHRRCVSLSDLLLPSGISTFLDVDVPIGDQDGTSFVGTRKELREYLLSFSQAVELAFKLGLVRNETEVDIPELTEKGKQIIEDFFRAKGVVAGVN